MNRFTSKNFLSSFYPFFYPNIFIHFNYDNFEESLNRTKIVKEEAVTGAFAEYTFSKEKISLMGGVRADYNSYYEKIIVTPRVHFKYAIFKHGAFRVSAGRGLHSANVIPENISILTSSRQLVFMEDLNGIMGFLIRKSFISARKIYLFP